MVIIAPAMFSKLNNITADTDKLGYFTTSGWQNSDAHAIQSVATREKI